ncbi:MAG: hypothetical protein KDA83_20700 [Planctomycetales bacterium]|nr:hypothetical protein [Planctomycetales bacterium]
MEEINAYHESGHAYMAVRVGARVLQVTLEPEWDDGPSRYADIAVEWPRESPPSRALIDRQLLVILAGPVAEMLYTGDKFHPAMVAEWRADWRHAWRLAALIHADDQQRMKYLEQLCAGVHETLNEAHHWAAVAAIADHLLAHETIEGEEVEEIVRQWRVD